MLEKVFKKKTVTADASQTSGQVATICSNSELCGQGNEASLKSPSSTWMSYTTPVAGVGLHPRDEHLVRAINKLVADKTRDYHFKWVANLD
jgi:hypothetical protein